MRSCRLLSVHAPCLVLLLAASCAYTEGNRLPDPPSRVDRGVFELDDTGDLSDYIPAIFSGVKLGSMVHDAGLTGETFEKGADGNMEILFKPIPPLPGGLGAPQPHLGVTMNSAGGTSQAYSGLTWTAPIYGSIFGGLSLGLAAHNGYLKTSRLDAKGLGSRFLFRTALELGYRFSPNHHIALVADHVSNAGLSSVNEGMDTVGIRFGYNF